MSIELEGRRRVPEDREALYRAKGYWTDDWLGSVVDASLREYAEHGFHLHSRTRPYHGTIGEIADAARRLAGELDRHGVGPGDVVAIQLPNSAEAAIAFWGTTLTGAIVAPIIHTYGLREVRYILEDSGAKVFLGAESFRGHSLAEIGTAAASLPTTEVVGIVGDAGDAGGIDGAVPFVSLTAGEPIAKLRDDVRSGWPAILAYTSGTTSNPKGVLHSHRGVIFDSQQIPAYSDPRPRLAAMPVGHFAGMLSAFFMPIRSGEDVHIMDIFEPVHALEIMREYDVALSGGATFYLTSLLDCPEFTESDAERLDEMIVGGAAIPNNVVDRAAAHGIRIRRMYGATEHSSITCTEASITDPSRYTDGPPLEGVEVRIVDEQGHDVSQGLEGEILSRGPDMFLGYTDDALTDTVLDADGWYHTGDLAIMDEKGNVIISGRKSDMIIRGGENISPLEVEEVLLSLPEIQEVAVIGIPDDRYGEAVCAVLVLEHGVEEPSLEKIRASCAAAELGHQKWPSRIVVATEFPRTPAGKVKKTTFREELAADS